MIPFSHRLAEVKDYFEHGDLHLGYRRLLDAAIETDNTEIYRQTLAFCDWYDSVEPQSQRPELRQRVEQLLERIASAYAEPSPAIAVKLKADGLSKTYQNGGFSLSTMSMELHSGQIIGLVGENGNGKTTLLRLLYGELRPDTGKLDYHFSSTRPSSFYDTKAMMAFVPQRPAVWYGSLMDNLQYATTYTGLSGSDNFLWTEMIIARMGLRPFRNHTWGRISSGYKMRFELARTLLRKPEILLLDEPLANLDMLSQQVILEDLKFLAQSETRPLSIILSSQQLYEVEKVSDQVLFLQKGVMRQQLTRKVEEKKLLPLIIELETTASRENLQQLLQPHGLNRLSFNGGVYILYFTEGTQLPGLLTILGQEGLPVKYLRDISTSSRRFFDA